MNGRTKTVVTWVLGMVIGGLAGYAWAQRGATFRQTLEAPPVLRGMPWGEWLKEADPGTAWTIMEDRTYAPFPTGRGSSTVARRFVARARLSGTDNANAIFQAFATSAEQALEPYQALSKGHFDLNHEAIWQEAVGPRHHRVSFPRRFYQVGSTHVVLDYGYVVVDDHVVLTVGVIEGR